MPVAIWQQGYEPPSTRHAPTLRTAMIHTLDLTMILFLVWLALDTPGL